MQNNPIVQENARTDGVMPKEYWDVPHTRQIEGFATDISVNVGEIVDFKINVNGGAGSDYIVEIFRLGYYGGDGARKVAEWVNTDAVVQPDAAYDATRALVDAGNWSVTDSWQTPADLVSGVFLARIQRLDETGTPIEGATNQIPFIVRDDDRPADIVLQTSDTTWHAYNGWFGNNGQIGANFYGDASGTVDHPDIPGELAGVANRAYAVSYNRPFITRDVEGQQGGPAAGPHDYLFGADYAGIHWLEQNGYDVAYISGLDTDRLGAAYLTKYNSFISLGHDEYWSGEQRQNVTDARDAGVNLLFWGGNDIYWKTRWETSIVDGVEYRTLVCYKETWSNTDPDAGPEDYPNLDPSDIWTGTWRDMRFAGNPLAGVGLPGDLVSGQNHVCNCAENALTGQLFGPDGTFEFGGALDVPEEYAPLRVWRDTAIADGGAFDLAPGIIGYEWNTSPDDAGRPAGLVHLSETTLPWSGILVDQGNLTQPGVATHNLSLYRAESGALVFGAGTVFWTWALSDEHDNTPYGANIENRDLQQFTLNLFADMGIQPGVADAVLASQNLVRASASTDTTPAVAAFTDLPESLPALQEVTLSGTASDVGGVVALVEVTFDGGATWRPLAGRETWSFTFLPFENEVYDIRVRAIDDSLNIPVTASLDGGPLAITEPEEPDTLSLLHPWIEVEATAFDNGAPIQLGTKFVPNALGEITALRYFRDAGDADDTDIRTGRLWDQDGTLVATVTFTSAPGEDGWQSAALAAPVTVTPGRQYTVSYETADKYVATGGFFAQPYSDPFGVLSAAGDAAGVYGVGGAVLPAFSYGSANYWVDISFTPAFTDNDPPVFVPQQAGSVVENTLSVTTLAAIDPEGDALSYSISGGADAGRFWVDASSGALQFDMAPDFEAPSDADGDNIYEVTVRVSDLVNINDVVEQTLLVEVTDAAEEQPLSTLFGAAAAAPATATTDPTDYELGTRFQTSQYGEVMALRYWRGDEDAGDTDTRTLNLWAADGTLIASATVSSGPGETGWQTAVLPIPVTLEAGQDYTVSYGTEQNYVYSPGFFGSAHVGPDGILGANASGGGSVNGVFSSGGTGSFPTSSYGATNYWADVVFRGLEEVNEAPAFTLAGSSFLADENQTRAAALSAVDAEDDPLTFAISGGADADRFAIDPATGLVTFLVAPDFEAPSDSDGDGIYEIVASVSDGLNAQTLQEITVRVVDLAAEPAPTDRTLFAEAGGPAAISTSDPTSYELGVRFVASGDGAVTSLRYWRGVEDAGDTDARTLTLWNAAGTALASVTVESLPGQWGWQTGMLESPVLIVEDAIYVVSYGTADNYVYTSGFFADTWTGPDGYLSAPGGSAANGVFAAGAPGAFPTTSYNATNYWVDLTVEELAPGPLVDLLAIA